METKEKKKRYKRIWLFLLAFLVCICSVAASGSSLSMVSAEGTVAVGASGLFDGASWQVLDNKLYQDVDHEEEELKEFLWDDLEDRFEGSMSGGVIDSNFNVSPIEKAFFKPTIDAFYSQMVLLSMFDIDITIDGLIYGRMSGSYGGKADFTHFGLEANNPYGIAGSSVFYIMRSILLGSVIIIFLIKLIIQLFKNTSKGRAELKEMVQNGLVVMVLLFAFPYLVNFGIYVRDGFLYVMSHLMAEFYNAMGLTSSFSFSGNITEFLYEVAVQRPTLINTGLYVAACGASYVFLGYYLFIAGLLTALFAFFPLIAILSLWNKRILAEWWNLFFPNLVVPIIDCVLLQIPTIVYAVYCMVFEETMNIILCIIIILLIFQTVKLRGQIMRLLGFNGVERGGAGLMGMMMLLMRTAGAGVGAVRGGAGALAGNVPAGGGDASAMADAMRERGAIMAAADRNIKELPEFTASNYGMAGKDSFSQTDAFLDSLGDKYTESSSDFGVGADMPLDASGLGMPDGMDVPEGGMVPDMGDGLSDVVLGNGDEYADTALSYSDYELGDVPGMSDVTDIAGGDMPAGDVEAMVGGGSVPMEGFQELPQVGMDFAPMEYSPQQLAELSASPQYHNDFVAREPLANMDSSYMSTLSPRDASRYQNLAHMDACNEKIRANEVVIGNTGYNPATYNETMKRCSDNVQAIDSQIVNAKQRLATHAEGTPAYNEIKSDIAQLESARRDNLVKQTQLKQGAKLSLENEMLRRRSNDYAEREEQFAKNSGLGGMSDKKYASAEEYKRQSKINEIKKKQADYRNFDSKQYEGILSPQERESFYRERAIREHDAKVLEAAKKAVSVASGVAVAAPGMALMAYGGPMAVGGAAMLGAKAGSLAGGAVGGVVSDAYEQDRKQQKEVVKTVEPKPVEHARSMDNRSTDVADRVDVVRRKMAENSARAEQTLSGMNNVSRVNQDISTRSKREENRH